MITSKEYVKGLLSPLKADANKYTAGYLMCYAGSYGMAGAAIFAAESAYRSGAGIVRLVVPKSIYPICAVGVPEAVYSPMDEEQGMIPCGAFEATETFLHKCTAVVFGCGSGLGKGVEDTLCKLLTRNTKPAVLDADGINVLSQHIDVLKDKTCHVVLTPHEGEMARLTGKPSEYIRNNRAEVACDFAEKYGVTVLLKGKDTVIADKDGRVLINPTGNPGLATAGSGDVLSGIIGAFLSSGILPFEAAAAGAYIHGLSGDIGASVSGERSLTARDIIKYLPNAFKEC